MTFLRNFAVLGFLALSLRLPLFADDEPLTLDPVEKGDHAQEALEPSPVPTQPTALPTAAPTVAAAPTSAPTAEPTPLPKPRKSHGVLVTGVSSNREGSAQRILIHTAGQAHASVETLHKPDRILVRLRGASLATPKTKVPLGKGPALRVRLGQKKGEVWAVIDLRGPATFSSNAGSHGFSLKVAGESRPSAPPSAPAAKPTGGAVLPKVDMMFFDRNVMYQGKQYDSFPCANFIYDADAVFPLEREFQTTFVFYQGYGAFVGNARVLDPDGAIVDQTKEPFAFNLFNQLNDSFATQTWRVRFAKRGTYKIVLTLNGEDTYEHKFYVGHSEDRP